MDFISNQRQKATDFNMEHFRIRLTARLGIILVCLLQYIPRLASLIANATIPSKTRTIAIIGLPFPLLMTLVILLEYFLYKKLGAGIVKYTKLVDFMLLIFFMGDWYTLLIGTLNRTLATTPISFQVGVFLGFTSFSWRTLMVTIIVEKWYIKILPPGIALSIATGYVIHYSPKTLLYTLLGSISQLLSILIIIYCEDKVKWKMIRALIQKERWMQVNNFILNSLPENIMVLDIAGETKFMSEYFLSFMRKCHLPLENQGFFKKVQDLHQQQQQSEVNPQSPSAASSIQIEGGRERATTLNGLLADHPETPSNQNLEDLIENFKKRIVKGEIYERQFQVYHGKLKIENQQEKSLEVKISFVQHIENYYIILIVRDTTQRDLLVTLEETNKYKDQLLASVSHELRAPLNGNINLVESAVNSPKIPISVKEALLIPALRSSKFLLHIINDFLDMSQIKAKKLRLAFHSENLQETLRSTAQLVELQAKKKGIELQLELDADLPTEFCTDHIRLSQIVLNLLNNGVKFTKEGVIRLTAKTMFETPSWVKITVQDSGIGMGQENIQKLFTDYTHIEFEGRQNMNPTGVGLGLNIAYNLALLLGPKDHCGINVKSIPGQGSTFTFILENKQDVIDPEGLLKNQDNSCEVADESPRFMKSLFFAKLQTDKSGSSYSTIPMLEKHGSQASCLCPKILIVDDNPFNTMAFETILDSMNLKCDSVYSGSSCLQKLQNRQGKVCGDNCRQYSVIFMDQEMPEMTGRETVYEIKKLQEENLLSQGIKIVGCTAHKSKEEIDRFMEAGLDQCIHKPISAGMIRDTFKGTNVIEK